MGATSSVDKLEKPLCKPDAITLDKIIGCVYGAALGDSMGLICETLTSEQIIEFFGKKLEVPFNYDIVKSVESVESTDRIRKKLLKHIRSFKKGDWTDDTDQLICIMDSICVKLKDQTKKIEFIFARKIKDWIEHGFPECEDTSGAGLGTTTFRWYSDKTSDPFLASCRTFLYDNRNPSNVHPNGAVMRTSVIGTFNYMDLDIVFKNAVIFAKTTHASPKCVASSIFISGIIALLLQNTSHVLSNSEKNTMIKTILKTMKPYLDNYIEEFDAVIEKHCDEFDIEFTKKYELTKFDFPSTRKKFHSHEIIKEIDNYAFIDSLDSLELNDNIGYTMKPIGCAMYVFLHIDDFSQIEQKIIDVINMGGDTDTNATVVGAVLGAYYGHSKLPAHLLHFPYDTFLKKNLNNYIESVYSM